MSENRVAQFQRNSLLEKLLLDLNADLQPSEQILIQSFHGEESLPHPLILVMGPLRSGTTLFMQWLSNTGLVAYPSNLLSRFYQAPIIGAKIQLLLTDQRYNFRDELAEFVQQEDYKSENGKTKGVLATNEFWYFWRRFLADSKRDVWSDEELRESMDIQTMRAELAGMMHVFQKPFAAKCMLFNYNIPFLCSVLDNVLFVQMKRDIETNVASVLEARRRQLGSEADWYSFDIPEKKQLLKLDPVKQVRGQIEAINRAVDQGMASIDSVQGIVVQYEEFCENPSSFFDLLSERLGWGDLVYRGPENFVRSR